MPGNVSKFNGKYFAHIHVALADVNYKIMGGHLKDGIVGATLELTVTPMQTPLHRFMNEDIGINIIRTPNNH